MPQQTGQGQEEEQEDEMEMDDIDCPTLKSRFERRYEEQLAQTARCLEEEEDEETSSLCLPLSQLNRSEDDMMGNLSKEEEDEEDGDGDGRFELKAESCRGSGSDDRVCLFNLLLDRGGLTVDDR